MRKKQIEPFNPWPGFVDLFASVIMVVLTFMLVTLINITYYSQFKYKVGYTGSVPIEATTQQNKISEKETEKIVEDDSIKDLEAIAGMDLTIKDSNATDQVIEIKDNWALIKYVNKEIILDPKSIKILDEFIKNKSKADIFSIYIQEPKNQISASIAKQIALSRALNIRNMLRKKGVNDSKVAIKLKEKNSIEQTIEHSPGYAMIVVNTQK